MLEVNGSIRLPDLLQHHFIGLFQLRILQIPKLIDARIALRQMNLHIRRNPDLVHLVAVGREILSDRQLHPGTVIAYGRHSLNNAFPVTLHAHDRGVRPVLERSGENLRRACTVFVDQNHQRQIHPAVAGVGILSRAILVLEIVQQAFIQEEIPYILRIRDGKANTETARIEIADNGTALNVGEDGDVSVTLTNPCQSIVLENLVLTLSDPGGDILPQGADSMQLHNLLPGESVEISFPVTVLSGAKVAPHSLKFDFSGAALGQAVTLSESYTFPVAQEIRLEQGGLRMASSVVAGDSITATLPLMNMGKADILNAMVTLSLPGVTERQSVLVETIAPGETKQAQLTVTAPKDALGDYTGTLTVEGEDNDGNTTSFELPVDLTVEEAVKTEMLDGQQSSEQKRPTAVYVLSAVCAALVVLLILQSVLLRSKIHRLEEERL